MSMYDMGTAVHEAAHAVLGVKLGFRVYEVYIYPDHSGQTSFGRVNLRDSAVVRAHAITILAGPVAELMHQGMPVTRADLTMLDGASSDMAKVGALLEQFNLTGILAETIELVKANSDAITMVAQKLFKDGSVEGDELGGMV